jgi:MFS family permease
MKLGIAVLVLAYGLSQFYRAFLAVLTPALEADIGATPEQLASASGVLFLVFAAMQIPIGAALDRIGPKVTTVVLFLIGGVGGALVFAMAQSSRDITIAMGLIGLGCAPVLMASYYIFARVYSPAVFATLAGAIIGLGSLGNLAGSAPLAWAAEAYGWRASMYGAAGMTFVVVVLLGIFIKDPPRVETTERGSVLDVLKIRALWPIMVIMTVAYAPSAGIRGLWIGPYATDVFGADAGRIGTMTLLMGLAMIAGSFTYGPLDRLLGTRKWVIFGGNTLGLAALIALALVVDWNIWMSTLLLAVIGMTGASFPMIVAHAKAFLPAHLTGRGVTLLNLFGIGGAGLMQFFTGQIHAGGASNAGPDLYATLFLVFAGTLAVGLLVYLFAPDRTD